MTVKTMVQSEILITRKPWNLLTMKTTHLDHLLRETYIFNGVLTAASMEIPVSLTWL